MVTGHGVLFLANPSLGNTTDHWLKLETDQCGTLQRLDSGRSTLAHAALDDDLDGPDEDDPSDEGRALIGRWLSTHSEITVINDGVDKSCDGDDDGSLDDQEFTNLPAPLMRTQLGIAADIV